MIFKVLGALMNKQVIAHFKDLGKCAMWVCVEKGSSYEMRL
jgi:hypothetical protein